MSIKIVCKDNSVRIVNPVDQFYRDAIKDPDQFREKVEKFIRDTGIVHKAEVTRDGENILNIEFERNAPEIIPEVKASKYKKWRLLRKNMRKELKITLKNPTFSFITRNGKTLSIDEIKCERKLKRKQLKPAA
jgi:hypothetical protein